MDFDSKKSFDDNLEAFLTHMETEDAEMGKILRDNISTLKLANDDVSRRRARSDFNKSVTAALDDLRKEEANA